MTRGDVTTRTEVGGFWWEIESDFEIAAEPDEEAFEEEELVLAASGVVEAIISDLAEIASDCLIKGLEKYKEEVSSYVEELKTLSSSVSSTSTSLVPDLSSPILKNLFVKNLNFTDVDFELFFEHEIVTRYM